MVDILHCIMLTCIFITEQLILNLKIKITGLSSVLTRPRPCGIPARKTEMVH